ncbi:MAG: hypothetical protein LH478_12140 [Chitinophagaceae bacterium]|nr:hypothetical protein [Chitinophagaceae bacterium]
MLFLFCCKPKPGVPTQSSNTDTVQFYQIAQFVTTQVNDVKKTPYYIFKKTNINGYIDSVQIDNSQFETLAHQFEVPDISELPLKKEYVENAFFDETTKTYTLNYSTKNKELEVQNIDVLLNADGSTLKRIFIRKFFIYNADSSAIEQLSWKPNEQFQISRVVQKPGQKETMYQSTIVWNENKGIK